MESNIPINYFDIAGSVRKLYARYLEPLCKKWDLTRNEMDVLLFLHNHPGLDRAVDISSGRGIAKSHVSQSVASLENRRLLHRRFDPADRRTAHLELTEQARLITDEGKQIQEDFFSAIYDGIPPEELALWKQLALKIRWNIEKENNTSPSSNERNKFYG